MSERMRSGRRSGERAYRSEREIEDRPEDWPRGMEHGPYGEPRRGGGLRYESYDESETRYGARGGYGESPEWEREALWSPGRGYGAGRSYRWETELRRHERPRAGTTAATDFRGRGPRGYQRSSERIREEVCERLTEDRDVDASDIEVEVKEATVVLRGTVEDRFQKRAAEDAAEDVAGIRDVRNELEVRKGMWETLKEAVTGKPSDAEQETREGSRIGGPMT